MLIGIISLVTMTKLCLYLTHQEPLAGLLFTTLLMFDDLAQIGHGLLIALTTNVEIGIGVVPLINSTEVHRVTTLLDNEVLGIVEPVKLCIALGLPGTGTAIDSRLRLIETGNIGEGGGSFLELSLLKL